VGAPGDSEPGTERFRWGAGIWRGVGSSGGAGGAAPPGPVRSIHGGAEAGHEGDGPALLEGEGEVGPEYVGGVEGEECDDEDEGDHGAHVDDGKRDKSELGDPLLKMVFVAVLR
jgi:hypothetical protein